MRDYGPDRPFSERKFPKELRARTHPGTKKFYKAHIKQNRNMPLEEYLDWVGVDYTASVADPGRSDFGLAFYPTGEGLYLYAEPRHAGAPALAKGDFILAIDEQPVNADNFGEVKAEIASRPVGSAYSVRLIREGQPQVVTCRTVAHTEKHLLKAVDDPSEEQTRLRSRWAEGTYD